MYKHYIRVDGNTNIIKAFSDAFEQPEEGDICITEDGDRHFNLDIFEIQTNAYKYKWVNNTITEKTLDEQYASSLQEAKDKKIIQIKKNTYNLLSYTDWYIIRKYERNIDIPESIITERSQIITNCDDKETAINNLETIEAVRLYE